MPETNIKPSSSAAQRHHTSQTASACTPAATPTPAAHATKPTDHSPTLGRTTSYKQAATDAAVSGGVSTFVDETLTAAPQKTRLGGLPGAVCGSLAAEALKNGSVSTKVAVTAGRDQAGGVALMHVVNYASGGMLNRGAQGAADGIRKIAAGMSGTTVRGKVAKTLLNAAAVGVKVGVPAGAETSGGLVASQAFNSLGIKMENAASLTPEERMHSLNHHSIGPFG